jgi:hypothetical protein
MAHYFADRAALLDESSREFLTRLVALGGYCTVSQAKGLNLAKSTRVRKRLRSLERLGFLRKVAAYPVVYQVTTSTARLLGRDSGSRRRHTVATVQARLLGVDFYLEARGWPSEFILDHERKIDTFTDSGYPIHVLPHRGGKPYLREQFVLWLPDGRLCVVMLDQSQQSAFSQVKQFVRQFQPALRQPLGELELLVVTGSAQRQRLYGRLLRHPRIRKLGLHVFQNAIKVYLVRRPTPSVAAPLWPASGYHEEIHDNLRDPDGTRPWRAYDEGFSPAGNPQKSRSPIEDTEFF